MDIIKNESIESGLKEKGRVYLCGNLEFPNGVEHIQTERYEIGVSYYPVFSVDKPHSHSYNTEYNYVLEGELKVLLIREDKEIHLKKGDLFVIHPDEPYIGKCRPGTKTLFSKVPGGNDKVEVPITDAVKEWSKQWDAGYIGKGEDK